MRKKLLFKTLSKAKQIVLWSGVVLLGVLASIMIALRMDEQVNSVWIITAAICVYLIFYRFYAAFIAAKVLTISKRRATPAVKLKDGKDYEPTNKWILFGHHFAAIAGPGPLIGPTLAAQFGYLPGMLWLLVGSVIGGCVQDMMVLFFSVRHNGKSLTQIARDELGRMGGIAAIIGTLMIMIILISVLGLVVINVMKHSAWATFTVLATIPIAIFIGVYMRFIRPGAILEGSVIGIILLIASIFAGQLIQENQVLRPFFDQSSMVLFWGIVIYGLCAAILPVWLLLAPRDYLSTFLKLGVVLILALAIILTQPVMKMPALTQFIDGSGPIFGGKIFPFLFITIACGAVSGFHALIASGTTPKLIAREKHIPMIGYGAMIMESFVALMALIAASIMEPGVFFAINSPVAAVGKEATQIVASINNWGYAVSVQQMQELSAKVGEVSLFNRTGGGPSLAVGMASIFSNAFGDKMLAIWYHFIIMFEAVFILTTLDAGTRVCRFMIQDALGNIYKPLGRTSWYPSVLLTSIIAVAAWGYFLYVGIIDPNGGINILWPLFGMANQILAGIALAVCTSILLKSDKRRYFWVSAVPLIWVTAVTLTAAWQKITSPDIRIGALAAARNLQHKFINCLLLPEQMAIAPKLIFNQYVIAGLSAFLAILLLIIVLDVCRIIAEIGRKKI